MHTKTKNLLTITNMLKRLTYLNANWYVKYSLEKLLKRSRRQKLVTNIFKQNNNSRLMF